MNITLKAINGNSGNSLYTVIHLDEDDLSQCYVRFWRGDSYEDIYEELVKDGHDPMTFVIEYAGTFD